MARKLNNLVVLLLLSYSATFISCTDEKDYYDPNYQKENPLGDITAPTSFDWSMTNSTKLNVTVDDQLNGQYYYLVEVYDENPFNNEDASALVKGVAKKGMDFTTEFSLNNNQKGIFIKQTDPKGRSIIRSYDYAKEINASFVTPIMNTNTRSISPQNEIVIPEVPSEYKSLPSGAITITNPGQHQELLGDRSYVINSDFNGKFQYWSDGQNIKLYIAEGVKWTIPEDQSIQTYLTVILLKGASIEATNISFVNGSDLIINPEASFTTNEVNFTNDGSFLLNWGKVTVNSMLNMPNDNETRNYGAIIANNIFLPNQADFINDGTIEVEQITLNTGAKLTNNYKFTTNGTITLTNDGNIVTNNNYMKCTGAKITNGILNNNCYFECDDLFETNGVTINLNKGYIIANNITMGGTKIFFNNGSMIESKTQIDHTTFANTYDGGSTNRSLMKAPVIIGQGFTYQGNLTIESDDHVEKEQYWNNFTMHAPAELAKLGESTVYIEDCIDIRNGGNEGEDPEDPEFPIINTDGKSYTYLFEDQWPLYGDYDMNDVVMNIKNITYTINENNLVEKYQFDFTLQALGANKVLAIATSLEKIGPNNIQSISYSDKAPTTFTVNNGVETGQQTSVIPLIDHAHNFLGISQLQFANTQSVNVSNLPTVAVTVLFNEPVAQSDLSINHFNLFIIADINTTDVNSNERKEVHVYGFAPTSKAKDSYFNGFDDRSKTYTYYASRDNLAWGIVVPENFKWAREYTRLTEAYTGFETWITSGGTTETDWYKNPVADKVLGFD